MTQTFDNIASVYSGKIVTWCGCSAGTHTDASTNKTPRDYLNTDDAKVKHVWDKVFGGKDPEKPPAEQPPSTPPGDTDPLAGDGRGGRLRRLCGAARASHHAAMEFAGGWLAGRHGVR